MKTTIRSVLLIALTTGFFTATLPVSFADAALSDNYMHNQTPDVVDAILENGTDQHMFHDTVAYVGKTGPQGPSWRGQPSREADHMINCINNCVNRSGWSAEVCIVDCDITMMETTSQL